ncbi:MAG: beta-N-acetylhexosaminidase [Acidobacteria bacterium]|nr:beta-N-acetylhexosaminidase [Acidobacteriota bacterium]
MKTHTFAATALMLGGLCWGAGTPVHLIFPIPQEMEVLDGQFALDETVVVALPQSPSSGDLFLARLLTSELSDLYGVALRRERFSRLPAQGKTIMMGAITNPLVKDYCARLGIQVTEKSPGPEGYVLRAGKDTVLVAGSDDRGAFYGLQSLRQLISKSDSGLRLPAVRVKDWPHKPFRGIRMYLPGRDNIGFFKRFVRDFMALYKYNHLILEMNAAMRLDRHPELNAGWIEFAKDLIYSRRDRPAGPNREYQNSAHHDTADGGILEKEEVAGLVRWARQHHVEVTPEIPSLTHSYYLLTRHRELAEIADWEWPDAYCPLLPKSYELLFDVFDEYLEVLEPRMVHIGHDEWRASIGVCPRCGTKHRGELFLQDVIKIHGYLRKKGVGVAMWGDHLIESVRGKGSFPRVTPTGYRHLWPGALTPEQVKGKFPKDILILNWFWREGKTGEGERSEVQLEEWGFRQAYGNFTPEMQNYERRSNRSSVIGGAPSSWAATTEFNFGKDLMYDFVGCANLLWSRHWPERKELPGIVQARMPQLRRRLSGLSLPSDDGDAVVPIALASHFNASSAEFNVNRLRSGKIRAGSKVFDLGEPLQGSAPDAVIVRSGGSHRGIPIGDDLSSLIFLHAAARPASKEWAYRDIFNFVDTADLLGWYEIVFEDGLIEPVPIRYGVNILEWGWGGASGRSAATPAATDPDAVDDPRALCYWGEAVACGLTAERPAAFFAFEWVNSRFGKPIKEVRLKAPSRFLDTRGKPIPDNAVILKALSVVNKRPFPDPVRARGAVESRN